MKLSELITLLQTFPQESEVLVYNASEYNGVLTTSGITYLENVDVWDNKDKKLIRMASVIEIIGGA